MQKKVYFLVESLRDTVVWKNLITVPSGVSCSFFEYDDLQNCIIKVNTIMDIARGACVIVISKTRFEDNFDARDYLQAYLPMNNINENVISTILIEPDLEKGILKARSGDSVLYLQYQKQISEYIEKEQESLRKNKYVTMVQKIIETYVDKVD